MDTPELAAMRLRIAPISQRDARAWVDEHHRHLRGPRGDVIRAAIMAGDDVVGVAQAGRPSARMLDDGMTLEILRVAVLPGHKNACSMLYAALRRSWLALGWRRFITYTLAHEHGASLRAAGWVVDGHTDGGEWSRPSRARAPANQPEPKTRWIWPDRDKP